MYKEVCIITSMCYKLLLYYFGIFYYPHNARTQQEASSNKGKELPLNLEHGKPIPNGTTLKMPMG